MEISPCTWVFKDFDQNLRTFLKPMSNKKWYPWRKKLTMRINRIGFLFVERTRHEIQIMSHKKFVTLTNEWKLSPLRIIIFLRRKSPTPASTNSQSHADGCDVTFCLKYDVTVSMKCCVSTACHTWFSASEGTLIFK